MLLKNASLSKAFLRRKYTAFSPPAAQSFCWLAEKKRDYAAIEDMRQHLSHSFFLFLTQDCFFDLIKIKIPL
jgi:hypothetical protein